MSMKPKIKVGDRFSTNICGWCTVVGYDLYSKITVEFDAPHYGVKVVSGSALKNGSVYNDNIPKLFNECVHNVFTYAEDSPSFLRWKVDRYSGNKCVKVQVYAGDVAGSLKSRDAAPYYSTKLNGKATLCHRIVWEMHNGKIPVGLMIDHIDGNGLNNAIENLRLATREVNSRNAKIGESNTTGVTGVKLQKNTDRLGVPYYYYVAFWRKLCGKQSARCFSVTKLGEEDAFRLACECRNEAIVALNNQGAGYTARHGV